MKKRKKIKSDRIPLHDNPITHFVVLFILVGLFVFSLIVIHKIESKIERKTVCQYVCWEE